MQQEITVKHLDHLGIVAGIVTIGSSFLIGHNLLSHLLVDFLDLGVKVILLVFQSAGNSQCLFKV